MSDKLVEKMKGEIQEMAGKLGININFDADAKLSSFRRGAPLKLGELRAMKPGDVVWVFYREHGESGARINNPMRLSQPQGDLGADYWCFEDGSSFGADFFLNEFDDHQDSALCETEPCGEGVMKLFHAKIEAPTPKKAKPKKRVKRSASKS